MGEEIENVNPETNSGSADGVSQERVLDWVIGLPGPEELIPLTQSLISPELAAAFNIKLDESSHLLGIPDSSAHQVSSAHNLRLPLTDESVAVEWREEDEEEADASALRPGNSCEGRMVKKPRLVWTPLLHERFAEVVAHLGEKAVPKAIMQLMNVEGLTRENVASHLQKYRLYQKRMQGISDEGSSFLMPDPIFDQVPEPTHRNELPSQAPLMIPFPVFDFPHHQRYQNPVGIMGAHHPYGRSIKQVKDWSGGNNFGSIVSYNHISYERT